ncbi:MAG: metal-dependent hydrolase [Lysobacteraceae bacterium]
MDSITHLFYGATICAAIAPAKHRRAALLAGAALNTLPDLDVFPLMLLDDPVLRMTWHRGSTHSLLVLPFIALGLWWWFRRRGGRVADAPRRWWWAILVTLLAHPLLDAFTVYGTQLWWPLMQPPAMWSSLFIIDPLFSLPWILAAVSAWFLRRDMAAQRVLVSGLLLGVGYLGWSMLAKQRVEQALASTLEGTPLATAPRFSVPAPLNTLLWRVVVLTPDGYLEGEHSLVADSGPIRFREHHDERALLGDVAAFPRVARLLWFNHHFVRAEMTDDGLLLSDLRMGSEPDYVFRFLVAQNDGKQWRPLVPVQRVPSTLGRSQNLGDIWHRIWQPPDDDGVGLPGQAAADRFGSMPAASASK